MMTPTVTEILRPLEAVTPDPFLARPRSPLRPTARSARQNARPHTEPPPPTARSAMRSGRLRLPMLVGVSLLAAGTGAAAQLVTPTSAKAATAPTKIADVRGWNSVRAFNGVQAWTTFSSVDRRWHVVVRRNGRTTLPAGIPAGDRRLEVDVGPGRDGKPALAFLRCATVCRVVVSDLGGRRAQTVAGSERASSPTIWGSRVAWVFGRATVMTRRFGAAGVTRLPGAPRRKCDGSRCRRPTGASVDQLELYRERLALITTYNLSDSSRTEVRAESVRGGPQRLIAHMTVAEGGQRWVGPAWARNHLYFYKSCPFGCSDGGTYRYDPDSGAYARRTSNTTLAGFAMDDDGRRAFEIPGPIGDGDEDTVPTSLNLSAPLRLTRARAPIPRSG